MPALPAPRVYHAFYLSLVTFAVAGWLGAFQACAEVKPNSLLGDGTVLQRGSVVPVWGTGREGETVTVKFEGQEATATTVNGRWVVRLQPMSAGGPFAMTIKGDNTVTITNVLVGDVWLCSGQSNMGFPLSRAANATEALASANDPQLRLFSVPHAATDEPKADVNGRWRESSSAAASNFSAVAWFFGRDLRRALQVPIALIDSSVGGTPAEAWTDKATLANNPALQPIMIRHAESIQEFESGATTERYKKALKAHEAAVAKAKAEGRTPPAAPREPRHPAKAVQRPNGLYNAMIAPLQPFPIAGVIWYQGEANSGRAAEYQKLFPALIGNWRQAWARPTLPFLFVQIAPYHQMTPEIREAQLQTWMHDPYTSMVVTTDVGEDQDIHPTRKEPVGARLALAARAVAYNEQIEYSGPVYDTMKIEGHRVIVSFAHLGKGLMTKGGALKGFTIAGADGKFVVAEARIEGQNVAVSSPAVPQPVAVRYGWAKTPDVNLYNQDGLPASPFRTDWPR